ncbi:helix-turn-helix domain-containing protein [Nocardia asteroides]|uniref:helix-turn-helix domain-containing protein n=1 Tax=Nocardia asteroides TaxID=1824 RepID=UPI0037C832B4
MTTAFGVEVARLRAVSGLSLRRLAELTHYHSSGLSRIEKGEQTVPIDLAQRLDAVLNADGALIELAGAVLVTRSASAGSTAFAEWALGEPAGRLSLQWIANELSTIAEAFVHDSPGPLLADLAQVRDRISAALRDRPSPAHGRDLLVLAGITIELMAQITENLGDPMSAREHVAAAEALARRCDHRGLLAWTLGTRALIHEWHGKPARAIDDAHEALEVAPPGDSRIRLWALIARCAARVGDTHRSRTAAQQAIATLESTPSTTVDDVLAIGGSLTFPTPKLFYYLGGASLQRGDHAECERWSAEAIAAYSCGPSRHRSYGDEALARSNLAMSRLVSGEIDAAREVVAPVFELPADRRISPVAEGLRGVAAVAIRTGSRAAVLADEIDDFLRRGLTQ